MSDLFVPEGSWQVPDVNQTVVLDWTAAGNTLVPSSDYSDRADVMDRGVFVFAYGLAALSGFIMGMLTRLFF